METRNLERRAQPEKGFLNFLRGMETKVGVREVRFLGSFLNFLRGMETLERPRPSEDGPALPKLP